MTDWPWGRQLGAGRKSGSGYLGQKHLSLLLYPYLSDVCAVLLNLCACLPVPVFSSTGVNLLLKSTSYI